MFSAELPCVRIHITFGAVVIIPGGVWVCSMRGANIRSIASRISTNRMVGTTSVGVAGLERGMTAEAAPACVNTP